MSNIDFNSVKNGLNSSFHSFMTKANDWLGRVITIIKSGCEKALPYFQDKRIAAVSLVAVNLILIELAKLFHRFVCKFLPHDTPRFLFNVIEVVSGLSVINGGVFAFSKFSRLPLSPIVIGSISVGTIFVRGCFEHEESEKILESRNSEENKNEPNVIKA